MAAPGGKITSLSTTLMAQLAVGGTPRTALASVAADAWFGPGQPLAPAAPRGTGGRLFDYPFGQNIQYVPRSTEPVSFAELRALADNLPLLRGVIETRKDQIAALPMTIRVIPDETSPKRKQETTAAQKVRIRDVKQFLKRPDRVNPYATWLRSILEDMLVIDAATIYPRPTLGGDVYSLDAIDGATIKPLVDTDGRRPAPPDPAFQQILKGVVAADFTQDELLYIPRNVRTNKFYGFSPVEQIILTVNIALRRDTSTLEYYRSGTVPDSFATLPKEWTADNIKQFQDYFDNLMQGNTQARRGMRFMPSDFKYTEAKAPPLKDIYDEWLARLICYAFSVPVSAFTAQVNRATAETARLQASQEGLVPLQQWIKSFMDHIVQNLLGEPELEFEWADGDTLDPVQQMTTLTGYVAAGIYNRDEARDQLGDDPIADGSGSDHTVSGATLSPARLPTPEEKAAEQERALSLVAARKPEPGDVGGGKSGETPGNAGAEGDAEKMLDVYVRVRRNDPVSREELAALSKYVERVPGGALGLLLKYDENQPRDQGGRFASTGGGGGKSERPSADTRPRDDNGRFINNGGSSRSYTAAAKRKRLIEGVKGAVERAVVGGALLGGAALVAAAFAPEAGAVALTIGIVRAVGTAAVGEAAAASVMSVLRYLEVPASLRDSVQSAVHLALGAYGLSEAKTNFDSYMAGKTKTAGETDRAVIIDAIQVVLYEAGQDVIERMKADAAKKAPAGSADALKTINDGLDATLKEFLDRVDALGGGPGGAGKHPVADVSDHPTVAQKVASTTERTLYVGRNLVNTDELRAWMAEQGFKSSLPASDMHVTTVYSKTPLVWPEPSVMRQVTANTHLDERKIELFGKDKDVVVLTFKSTHLDADNARLMAAGAKSDFPEYRSHVTLTYDLGSVDPTKVEPFRGALIFGPEYMREIKDEWHADLVEAPLGKVSGSDTLDKTWRALEPMWQAPAHEARSVRRFKKTLSSAFETARAQVAAFVKAELKKVSKAVPSVETLAQEVASKIPLDAFGDAAGPLSDAAEQAAREIADGALVRVGLGDDESMVERVSKRAVDIARARAAELVGMRWDAEAKDYAPSPNPNTAITDSTRDMIRTIVADGLESNLSADEIADNIESSAAFSPERADLVAKTEIANVNSSAALETYRAAGEAGVKLKKRWIVAAKDVCDDCTLNAKQGPIDLDEAFQSGDQSPAAHPHCRCAVAPVVYEGESDDGETVEDRPLLRREDEGA